MTMTQIHCHMRGTECPCQPSECRSAPPNAITAPSLTPEPRDFLAVFAFAIVMVLLAAGTMHALNQKEIQLTQEARV